MGFTIIDNSILEADETLKPMEKLLLIYLIKYHNDTKGYAFPSMKVLTKHLGYSHDRYTKKSIDALIEKGYIRKETVKQKNRYYLTSKVQNVPNVQNVPKVQNVLNGEVQNVPNSKVQNVPTKNTNKNTNKKISKKNIYVETSDEYRLAKYLFELIRKNNPTHKEPNLQDWAKHIDRMIRLDKREVEDIEAMIYWCQQHYFWHTNILSTEKLRKQYDQLSMQMKPRAKDPVEESKGKVLDIKIGGE